MPAITNIEDFRAHKAAVVKKWGEKLVNQSPAEMKEILKDCEPLARYGRLPVARILSMVTIAYLDQH